jgi:hypothetical protein
MRVPGKSFVKVEPKVADLVWGRDEVKQEVVAHGEG